MDIEHIFPSGATVIAQQGSFSKYISDNRLVRKDRVTLKRNTAGGSGSYEFKKRLLLDWEVYESDLVDHRIGDRQTLVISSDIIESYFGKYKQKIKHNANAAYNRISIDDGRLVAKYYTRRGKDCFI